MHYCIIVNSEEYVFIGCNVSVLPTEGNDPLVKTETFKTVYIQ